MTGCPDGRRKAALPAREGRLFVPCAMARTYLTGDESSMAARTRSSARFSMRDT